MVKYSCLSRRWRGFDSHPRLLIYFFLFSASDSVATARLERLFFSFSTFFRWNVRSAMRYALVRRRIIQILSSRVWFSLSFRSLFFLCKVRSGIVAKWRSHRAHTFKKETWRYEDQNLAMPSFLLRTTLWPNSVWLRIKRFQIQVLVESINLFWNHRVLISEPLTCKARTPGLSYSPLDVQHTFILSLQSF